MADKTLRDFVPREFVLEYQDSLAYKYLDETVTKEYGHGTGIHKPWPGHHKHIYNWGILSNGYAVGWNESPSRGWSFPIVRIHG